MIIPGVPNPFQRFPGADAAGRMAGLFDPGKPFGRAGGWPGLHGGQKRSSPMEVEEDLGLTLDQKKMRLQTSMRMLKDEPVPEGYMRFRSVGRLGCEVSELGTWGCFKCLMKELTGWDRSY